MKLVFYTTTLSPHQIPLARELVKILGENEYRYIYTRRLSDQRKGMGWNETQSDWVLFELDSPERCRDILENCDVLFVGGVRDLALFERRKAYGKKTFFCSERWFKPKFGILRLCLPSYFRMAIRFSRLLRDNGGFMFLPIGIHAARDMARLCGLLAGDLRCVFKAPELKFEKRPGGRLFSSKRNNANGIMHYCLGAMRIWGYFVEGSNCDGVKHDKNEHDIKILWVGRLLDWKHVDTILHSVREYEAFRRKYDMSLKRISLDIYGMGPEGQRLKHSVGNCGDIIQFHDPVPIAEVRNLMRNHDIYVLSSDSNEGWGAVVSEALEEGMYVIGTYEAGSSATILPDTNLFHAGDWQDLLRLLKVGIANVGIGPWTAKNAARELVEIIK